MIIIRCGYKLWWKIKVIWTTILMHLSCISCLGGDQRFKVDANTGEVKTIPRSKFLKGSVWELAVSAQIVGIAPTVATLTQVLRVVGVDLSPQFWKDLYIVNMDEFSRESRPTCVKP